MADTGPEAGAQIPVPRRRGRSRGPGSSSSSCSDIDCAGCDPCDLFNLSLFGVIGLAVPHRAPRRRASGPALAGIAAIRAYQRLVSPRLGVTCRHEPSCSRYGIGVVRRYGLVHGARLAAGRISRCTAAVPHGTPDPVP
jgi:putative membrane protein insertion efficiency factor